ncbi:RsmB/NOP family class I SAM-dependent RNA methyltransferase [Mobilicoccus caccae]|uniref:rRNA cytosine-C5-methyltransferase n=1 Tax=Mobilicoccus caccae TaxID=1859295 RepID=A0ABQ6IR08_9MICO|nr:transcription antitermination factor NusB [Mobilicoccus caccae]GMA39889.1 rRNA cytosine-C5-methyltransferase [Mobilicoccus caccae]
MSENEPDRPDRRHDRRGGGRPERRERPGTGRVGYGGQARRTDPGKRSSQRPSERRRHADPARSVAYETLRAVSDGAYANLELPGRLRRAHLGGRDAAFATELVYGVTRMRGFYDAVLARCSDRAPVDMDPPVLDVLRLGVHQLLGMRVPAHAAVDATVGLTRGEIGAGAASFVNAVLRRVSETPAEDWMGLVAPGAGRRAEGTDDGAFEAPTSLEDVGVAHSHPGWIVRALRAALLAHGASTPETVDADLLDLLHAHNVPADVTLIARPGLLEVEDLLEAGASPGTLSPYAAILTEGGDPGGFPAVRDGRAAVQDEGSQVLVLALVEAYDRLVAPGASEPRWLDLCAGPGGKAGLLAALSIPRGATLFANETSEHRAELVESAVGAAMDAGAEVFVGVGDGRRIGAEEPNSFDLVLIDAPCTGLGALRRRPDARWRRTPADVGDLTALQEDLLSSGLDALRPGGVLGYATCSPHEAETIQVVNRVTRGRADVELLDAGRLLDSISRSGHVTAGRGSFVQLWPHVEGTDAMFFAVMRRREAPAGDL